MGRCSDLRVETAEAGQLETLETYLPCGGELKLTTEP